MNKTVQGNTQEKDEILKRIQRAFSPPFRVVRVAETNLGGLAPDGSRRSCRDSSSGEPVAVKRRDES